MANTNNVSNGKKPGCLYIMIIAVIIWLIGFYYLYQASVNRPVSSEKSEDSSYIFEIIPGSNERTSVDDNMEDRERPDNQASE